MEDLSPRTPPFGTIGALVRVALLTIGVIIVIAIATEGASAGSGGPPSVNFTVHKDWSPDRPNTTVTVSVTCDGFTSMFGPVTEETPHTFTVVGATSGATCTAFESLVPTGYLASGSPEGTCQALASAGECTITNTERIFTLTLITPFSDNVEGPVVNWAFNCPNGIQSNVDTTSTDLTNGGITITRYTQPVNCTWTPTPPPGYHLGAGGCTGTAGGAVQETTCTQPIVPGATLNFLVKKNWSPDRANTPVSVTLSCPGSTVDPATAQNATEETPASFSVTTPDATLPTCTATESPVPAGYHASGSPVGTCQASLGAGECTITNTLRTAAFVADPSFSDVRNGPVVNWTFSCDSGTKSAEVTTSTHVTDGGFTLSGFNIPTQCTMDPTLPAGYVMGTTNSCIYSPGTHDCTLAGDTCQITIDTSAATYSFALCAVFLDPSHVKFTVDKDFVPDATSQTVSIKLTCSGTTAEIATTSFGGALDNTDDADESTNAEFYVSYTAPGNTCTATEETALPAHIVDQSQCANKAMAHGVNVTCTITSTLNIVMFHVHKEWQPVDGRQVVIKITCNAGANVTVLDPTAGQLDAADFIIEGGTSCTASETTPAGYTSNQTDCAAFNPTTKSDCTIINRKGTEVPTFTPGTATPIGTPNTPGPTPVPGTPRPTRTPRPAAGLTATRALVRVF